MFDKCFNLVKKKCFAFLSVLGGLTKKHTNTLPVNLMSRELGSDDHEPDEYEHGHAIIFYEPFFLFSIFLSVIRTSLHGNKS